MIKIILGIVIGTIALIGVFLVLDPNVGIVPANTNDVSEIDKNTFSIVVEGAVYKPGSYTMKDGDVMSDLIEAAGGVKSNADSRAYYEDAVLVSGMNYYIASKYDADDLCNNTELDKVNINLDDVSKLTTVSGITTTIANSIVTYRNENGLFSTVEGLMEVYGIGNATYKKIRNYVILHE